MDPPNLSSEHEQLVYFRELAEQYYQKNLDLQREYDDYTTASAQLEKELETTIDQKEKTIRELRQQNMRLERETEFLKKKVDRSQQEYIQMESELKILKNEKERHLSCIRELEQKNDDLERAQRVISESVDGIETLLNQAYEKNAVLESEIDEMENLRIKLQRVTDEARDLKQELFVKEVIPNGNIPASPALKKSSIDQSDINKKIYNGHVAIDSNRLMETETQTSLSGTPLKCDLTLNGNTMTPSSRISALNIVGDLLRKVGLERFLCPECSKVRCICLKTEKLINSPNKEDTQLNITSSNTDSILKMPDCDANKYIKRPDNLNLTLSNVSSFQDTTELSNNSPNQSPIKSEKNVTTPDTNIKSAFPKDIYINLFRNSSIRRSHITPKPPPRSPTKGKSNVIDH